MININMLSFFILFFILNCGNENKQYKVNVITKSLFEDSFFTLLNTASNDDLACLKMSFQVTGISDGAEAFTPVRQEGTIDLDRVIERMNRGERITLETLVISWDSPVSITISDSVKNLKILINGFYALCYRGKPVNVVFFGEKEFKESELGTNSLVIPLTATTSMPVNATRENFDKIKRFYNESENLVYTIINHNQDALSTTPFYCSDTKVAGNTPNKVKLNPRFLQLDATSGYLENEIMFDDEYLGYYYHDFNYIETDNSTIIALLPNMMVLPIFSNLPYEITYTQGTGDGCSNRKSITTKLKVTKDQRDSCDASRNKFLVCDIDWDIRVPLQNHVCTCRGIPL